MGCGPLGVGPAGRASVMSSLVEEAPENPDVKSASADETRRALGAETPARLGPVLAKNPAPALVPAQELSVPAGPIVRSRPSASGFLRPNSRTGRSIVGLPVRRQRLRREPHLPFSRE